MTTSHQKEQRERRELLGSTTGMTYRDRAAADIALLGQGRHTQGASVTGSARVPQYPAASGPWNDPVQVPDEPSLGVDLNYVEPCGEAFEIEASLMAAPQAVPPEGAVATEVGHSASGRPAPSEVASPSSGGAPTFIRNARRL
jgi:hypothetical protein